MGYYEETFQDAIKKTADTPLDDELFIPEPDPSKLETDISRFRDSIWAELEANGLDDYYAT